MAADITPTKQDIQIAGTRLCDYIRDLLIISGHPLPFSLAYQEIRKQFGNAIVSLVEAIKADADG